MSQMKILCDEMEKNEEEEMGFISLVGFLVMLVGLMLLMLKILTRIFAPNDELLVFFLNWEGGVGGWGGGGFNLIWVSVNEFVENWPS